MKYIILSLLILTSLSYGINPEKVNVTYWHGLKLSSKIKLTNYTTFGSILIVKGISNKGCMQGLVDGFGNPFTLVYAHDSNLIDGGNCEEKWCLKTKQSTNKIRVFGTWFGLQTWHAASASEHINEPDVKCSAVD